MNLVNWTPVKLALFRKEYDNALAKNKISFKWNEHEYLVNYAKYLLEYLEGRFK